MLHKHVGQLVNQSKGMRSSLWSVEEEIDLLRDDKSLDELRKYWEMVKASHRKLRFSLQVMEDLLPD